MEGWEEEAGVYCVQVEQHLEVLVVFRNLGLRRGEVRKACRCHFPSTWTWTFPPQAILELLAIDIDITIVNIAPEIVEGTISVPVFISISISAQKVFPNGVECE